ncbi:MAG: hypothetical protein JXR83_18585, partial [Deltaproteobacteria bacterium]|nr:hypothetical protein [Deltaproteobacteria bacterium]
MNQEKWANLNQTHVRTLASIAPDLGSALGELECDRRLPAAGADANAGVLAALHAWRDALRAIPAEDLEPEQELDRFLFIDRVALIELVAERMAQPALDADALCVWGRRLVAGLWQRPPAAEGAEALAALL